MTEKYNVELTDYDRDNKIKAVHAIRKLTGTGLGGAMDLLAIIPCGFLVSVYADELDQVASTLKEGKITFTVTCQSSSPMHDPKDGSNSD